MGPQHGQHLGQPLGPVAERQPPAVFQQAEPAGADIFQRAVGLVAGGGPGRVAALEARGKVGRVAGAEVKTALPLPVGAQVRADGGDVGKLWALRGHGFRQQGAGLRLQLQGRAGAPVAAVVPLQADNAAARTQVGCFLAAFGRAEPGQQ